MMTIRVLPPTGARIPWYSMWLALAESVWCSPEPTRLKSQMIDWTGLRHWTLSNSGRSALTVALRALVTLRPDRAEVVIPAYTSYSVPAAVVRAGLRVRLCDVEMETLGISPKELERAFTPKTLCVVPNHLYGTACQIKAVCEIACDQHVPVIEDAAQAMGVQCVGQPVSTFGDVALFSLSRGKTLPAAGGGLIGTNDERLAKQCEQIVKRAQSPHKRRQHIGFVAAVETALMAVFIRPSLYWLPVSLPFLQLGVSIYDPSFRISPMSRFQQALAARLLPSLGALQTIRARNAMRIVEALVESQGVWVIWPRPGDTGGFLRLPVLVTDPVARSRIVAKLEQKGLGATGGYPMPLSELPRLRPHLSNVNDEFPVARKISERLVTLPTHQWVQDRDIEQIAEVFRQCLQ